MRLFLLLCLLTAPAFAQDVPSEALPAHAPPEASIVPDDPYTISDVVVDVTADNAVEARAQAFEKGAAEAVAKFLILQGSDLDPESVDPDSLVRDFQVNEERFSRTRYTAVLTYRFKPGAMASLINPSLPPEQALPVPEGEEAFVPEDAPAQNYDPDAPWNPNAAPGDQPAPPSATGGLSTWPLTVRFDAVAQWLQAQTLITARPEIRGFKIVAMSGDSAQLEITTEGGPSEVMQRWNAFGWNVASQGGGLFLDAARMGR